MEFKDLELARQKYAKKLKNFIYVGLIVFALALLLGFISTIEPSRVHSLAIFSLFLLLPSFFLLPSLSLPLLPLAKIAKLIKNSTNPTLSNVIFAKFSPISTMITRRACQKRF